MDSSEQSSDTLALEEEPDTPSSAEQTTNNGTASNSTPSRGERENGQILNNCDASEDSILKSDNETSCDAINQHSDDESNYANPELPSELQNNELMNADMIGNTVYSKRWLIATLMNLIKAVDAEENSKQETAPSSECGLDLEDDLQDELCKLWDMSMNSAVVSALMEFNAVDLLSGVVSKSKAPRAIEICVGILANMACKEAACTKISFNEKLRQLVLFLLESPDAPILVETTRLLCTCMSSDAVCDLWITSIRDTPSVYDSLLFILQSSTNCDLLSHAADLIDKILDTEDDIIIQWSTPLMVQAILEAVKQCKSSKSALDTFLHILQLISTCDVGIEALGCHSKMVCTLAIEYLIQLCGKDIVILDGEENTLSCVLCVLSTAFQALEDKVKVITQDFQLMRCLLKILCTVYPHVRQFTPGVRHRSTRSDSISDLKTSEGKNKFFNFNNDNETHKPDNDSSLKEQGLGYTKTDSKSNTDSIDLHSDDNVVSDEKSDVEITGISATENIPESEIDSSTWEMLYEVLQNILTDLILLLSEENDMNSMTDDDCQPATVSSNQSECSEMSHDHVPKTLTYLNDLCERDRLRILVYTLDEVTQDTEMDLNSRLTQAAKNHKCCRLERIIGEYSAS